MVGPVPTNFERERYLANNLQVPMRARFFERSCDDGSGGIDWYLEGARDAGEVEEVTGLLEEVLSRLTPDPPTLVTSPPSASGTLTGFPTYLAVDGGELGMLTDEISGGGLTVRVTLEPVGTRFDPGDGSESRTCDGAGTVWRSGDRPGEDDCTHTYVDAPAAGVVPLSAEVVYAASYEVAGEITGTFDLGEVTSPAGQVELPVTERRAVRIGP